MRDNEKKIRWGDIRHGDLFAHEDGLYLVVDTLTQDGYPTPLITVSFYTPDCTLTQSTYETNRRLGDVERAFIRPG